MRIGVTLGVLLVLLGAAPAASAATPVPPLPQVVSGDATAPGGPFLRDAEGRRLLLQGVNLVPKCGAHTSPATAPGNACIADAGADRSAYLLSADDPDPARRFTPAEADTLRSMGVDVVRLGIIWGALEPGPAGVQPDDPTYCAPHVAGQPYTAPSPYNQATVDAYLAGVDQEVETLSAAGLRVIVDMHQDAWGPAFGDTGGATPWLGEGAPLWATCTDGAPSTNPSAWSNAYEDLPPELAFHHFWQNDVQGDLQGEYAKVWSAVAQHFAANPAVLGYEVFNEPIDPEVLTVAGFDRELECFYGGSANNAASCLAATSQAPAQGIVPVVEAADPKRLVFVEPSPLTNMSVPETLGALGLKFPRLVLSFHVYGLTGGLAAGAQDCTDPTCQVSESTTIGLVAQERKLFTTGASGGPAWLMTEYGAEKDPTDIGRVEDLADSNLVGAVYWAALQLDDPTGSSDEGLLDQLTGQPDAARASVLASVHAVAVAGDPTAQTFDPSSQAFHLAWTPDAAVSAPTVVEVPRAWHEKAGYSVTVTGAHVTSAPGAELLTVVNDGTAPATLDLTPDVLGPATVVTRPAPPRQAKKPKKPVRTTKPGGTLAYTGGSPTTGAVALLLLAGGVLLRRGRAWRRSRP